MSSKKGFTSRKALLEIFDSWTVKELLLDSYPLLDPLLDSQTFYSTLNHLLDS